MYRIIDPVNKFINYSWYFCNNCRQNGKGNNNCPASAKWSCMQRYKRERSGRRIELCLNRNRIIISPILLFFHYHIYMHEIERSKVVPLHRFFVRMRRFLLILDAIYILCSVYLYAIKVVFEVRKFQTSISLFYLSRDLNKLSIKYQSYPKSTDSDKKETCIYNIIYISQP